MALQFPTRAERPGSLPHASGLDGAWPEFMYHDTVLNRLFGRVISEFAEFQYYAWDDEREEVVGVGNAIPQPGTETSRACPTEESTRSSKPGSPKERRHRPSSAHSKSSSLPTTVAEVSAAA